MEKGKQQNLFETASVQQGYFTARQALKAGFSYRMQTHYRQNGEWIEIRRGIFRLARFPNSPNEDYAMWSLWSADREGNPQAVISHDSALSIHELSDIMPARIHVTVPPGFRKKTPEGGIIHKAKIPDNEKEQREGFFVTTPLRTIMDSADSSLSTDYLEQAIRQACDTGLIRMIDVVGAEMSEKAREKITMVFKQMKNKPAQTL